MELKNKLPKGTILVPNSRFSDPQKVTFSYNAAETTRHRKSRTTGNGIRSEEIELDWSKREIVISTLLNFKRNNPIIKGILRLRRSDVVGSGIKAYPKTGNEDLDKQITEKWEEYSENPEITGVWNMADVQKFLTESTIIFGDSALIFTDNGQVQAVEGSQVGSEGSANYITSELDKNRQGVTIDNLGRPVSYSVGTLENGRIINPQQIPANLIAFHYKKQRTGQVRGIPELVTVLNDLQDIDEWDEIEMVAAKVAATLGVFIKRDEANQWEIGNRDSDQDEEGRLETIEPGRVEYLNPNEDIGVVSANGRPNTDAVKYLIYRMQKIGTALGIPVEFLLQTIGDSSFSASQGVVLQYQQSIVEEQRALQPVMNKWYKWRLGKWIADGEIIVPDDTINPFRVDWQPQGFRWINRAAQVDADRNYMQMGAMSLDDVTSQFGKTSEQVQSQIARNIKEAAEKAAELNKSIPDDQPKANWMQFYNPYITSGSFAFEMGSQAKIEADQAE